MSEEEGRGDPGMRRPTRHAGMRSPVLPPAPHDQVDELRARHVPEDDSDAPPPVGGSWHRLYTGVVLTLVLYILAFWLFTRVYTP